MGNSGKKLTKLLGKRKLTMAFKPWRFYCVITIVLVLFTILSARIVYLSVIKQDFLRTAGNLRSVRVIGIPAFRGMILDRNQLPLAVSAQVYSIWVNPQQCKLTDSSWQILAKLLAVKLNKVIQQLGEHKHHGREFWYLRRAVAPELALQIQALHLAGVYLQPEQKRYYPAAEVNAHILGFTNIDDHGQEGLELWFNDWLQGIPGKKLVVRDRLGNVITDLKVLKAPHPGKHLILSIDNRMQYIAYRELQRGVLDNQAASGSAIIVYVPTGEILAMVNYPAFDPNQRKHKLQYLRNNAVTDIFEPGSTIKAFSAAVALASKKFTPNTWIDTNPGWLKLNHNLIRDEKNYGVLTLAQIIQVSSDVGTAKAILALPPQALWSVLQAVGFGESTGIEFPGEKLGVLNQSPDNGLFMRATLSFGYGMSSTLVQLAKAYTVFAHHGLKIPLTLLKRDHVPEGQRVMSPELAQQMLVLLESVVANKIGTGRGANMPGYRIAGKTGTVRVLGAHGYDKNRHNAMFVGITSVTNPLFVTAIIIRDSYGKHFSGSSGAAPVFARIMTAIVRMLNIAPDNQAALVNKFPVVDS